MPYLDIHVLYRKSINKNNILSLNLYYINTKYKLKT